MGAREGIEEAHLGKKQAVNNLRIKVNIFSSSVAASLHMNVLAVPRNRWRFKRMTYYSEEAFKKYVVKFLVICYLWFSISIVA